MWRRNKKTTSPKPNRFTQPTQQSGWASFKSFFKGRLPPKSVPPPPQYFDPGQLFASIRSRAPPREAWKYILWGALLGVTTSKVVRAINEPTSRKIIWTYFRNQYENMKNPNNGRSWSQRWVRLRNRFYSLPWMRGVTRQVVLRADTLIKNMIDAARQWHDCFAHDGLIKGSLTLKNLLAAQKPVEDNEDSKSQDDASDSQDGAKASEDDFKSAIPSYHEMYGRDAASYSFRTLYAWLRVLTEVAGQLGVQNKKKCEEQTRVLVKNLTDSFADDNTCGRYSWDTAPSADQVNDMTLTDIASYLGGEKVRHNVDLVYQQAESFLTALTGRKSRFRSCI